MDSVPSSSIRFYINCQLYFFLKWNLTLVMVPTKKKGSWSVLIMFKCCIFSLYFYFKVFFSRWWLESVKSIIIEFKHYMFFFKSMMHNSSGKKFKLAHIEKE
jgi:hypothetical protein